ncbi:hypothetical protein NLU13_7817 [Sarocladium strictum]|uniref:Phospholipase/carboxylesterase/thioesterase domain-containing protein n=1 Tax=Sarocladium strictum TaxID=5046 RepID=A0AA39GDT9_SARSR|nr:hypothetical protein NLU13_7817 [Sarocladium strictum]
MSASQPAPRGPGEPIYRVEPLTTHTHTILLLHGLGSNGEKFGKELLETGITSSGLTLPQLLPGARFLFPTSRRRRSTAFGRSMLTQWFDIANLQDPELRKEKQLKGLGESAQELFAIVQKELEMVPARNLILGGLSQGCAIGYLTYQSDLQDSLAENEEDTQRDLDEENPFSTPEVAGERPHPSVQAQNFERDLLGLQPLEEPAREKTAYGTPVFLGHGVKDEKVPLGLGTSAARVVRSAGYEVRWRAYEELGHWYQVPEEVDDIVDFISSVVGWPVSHG